MSIPKIPQPAITILSITAIFLLIVTKMFTTRYLPNEVDVLPFARQFSDPDWLRNDWYLNLDITYRNLFNAVFGPIVSWLGFDAGKYAGRFMIYLLLSAAVYDFLKAVRLNIIIGLIALFFFLGHQSIVAGEWIVNGVDTKSIAYACVIFSLAALVRKKYIQGFAFIGASISFHPLVGIYSFYCALLAILANKEWREQWQIIIKQSWPLLITGLYGFWSIFVLQIQNNNFAVSDRVWWVYTVFRLPHHTLPGAWDGHRWDVKLSLAVFLFAVIFSVSKSLGPRFLASYGLASVSLFLIGLGLYAFGDIHILRLYWFRFPDTIVPLLSLIFSGIIFEKIIKTLFSGFLCLPGIRVNIGKYNERHLRIIAGIVVLVGILAAASGSTYNRIKSELDDRKPIRDSQEWILNNTPEDAVFLIDPTIDNFYVEAQRAVFVSYKHLPQSPDEIMEWYERIKICNGNRPPEKIKDSFEEIQTNFYNLDETSIRSIAKTYGIDYYLGLPNQKLTFNRIYSDSYYTLYQID